MFRVTDRWMRLTPRGPSLAMLLAISLVISNLSPRCGFATDKPTHPATPKKTNDERPPFDLTYVPPDAMGVIALRPNAIFAIPAMKPLCRMVKESFLMEWLFSPIPFAKLKLPLQEIEQVVVYMPLFEQLPKGDDGYTLRCPTVMIRTVHDFDWLKQMKQLDPNTKRVRRGGGVYYRSHFQQSVDRNTKSSQATFSYLIPDKRTLVLLSPSLVHTLDTEETIQRPHFSWDKDWKYVEHGLCAAAFDSRGNETNKRSNKRNSDKSVVISFIPKAEAIVGEMEWADGIDLHAFLTCKDQATAAQTRRDVNDFLSGMRFFWKQMPLDDFRTPKDEKPFSEAEREAMAFQGQLWQNLLNHVQVTRQENTVCVHTIAKINIAEIVKMFQSETEQEKKP